MPGKKYAKCIIQDAYKKAPKDYPSANIFNYDNRDKGGYIYEYHCINKADWGIKDRRVNDTWEMLCFIGADLKNIRNLGAEVSICLGEDKEEHIINDAAVISIPPGLKYGPIVIKKYTKPFVLLRIVTTKEYEAKKAKEAGEMAGMMQKGLVEGMPGAEPGKKFWMNIVRGPFYIAAEPGWEGTSFWAHHDEYKSGMTLGYHCVTSTYQAMRPHAHDFHELLCFLGSDPENVEDLGAEVSVTLGKETEEREEYVFNKATILSMPPGTTHCPVIIRNVKKPVLFLEVCPTREFGAAKPKKAAAKKPAKKK